MIIYGTTSVGTYNTTICVSDYYGDDSCQDTSINIIASTPDTPKISCTYGNFWINCTALTAKEWVVYQNE